jgi:glucose-1-phosphate thymidylyltransferase
MIALIPAAGYATRLYPLTLNTPKALLDVCGKKMIEHVISKIEELEIIKDVVVVTNARFFLQFEEWAKSYNGKLRIKVLNDGTTSNETRLGAIGDFYFAIKSESIDDDLLIINSDNVFTFSLKPMLEEFKERKVDFIGAYDLHSLEEAKKMGVPELDSERRIVGFVEKPEQPKTTLCSAGLYMYTKDTCRLFKKYIDEGNPPDKTGHFVEWLYKRKPVYAFIFESQTDRWFDIGTPEMLEEVRRTLKG